MKKEARYYIAIFVVIALFLISSLWYDMDRMSKYISTILALIGGVTFWLQLKRNERLNESSYIMNLNNQFVNNKDMTMVEHVLELYFNEYQSIYGSGDREYDTEELPPIELHLDLSRESEDCQKLINYLVYLEALAAIIKNNVLHLNIIDDLFAYRFFLAVNNPIVQETELIPYKPYYNGIYYLSKEWTKIYNKRRKTEKSSLIPLDDFNLAKIDIGKKIAGGCTLSIVFNKASLKDSFEEIAECIYDTDPYIYPAAFGDEREFAIKSISRLIGLKDGLFDLNNIIVARYNGHIIGTCLVYDKPSPWLTVEYFEKIRDIIPEQRRLFEYTSRQYFEETTSQIGDGEAYIMAFCISKSFRGRGVSKQFLCYILDCYRDKTVLLEVLSDNKAAVELYKKMCFEVVSEKDGFSLSSANDKPKCYIMKKESDERTQI